jgi:four helix bundle protein
MDYKDLDVWKRGISLTTEIYRLVEEFPKIEQFGLSSQLTRATVSIPSNIAEGNARASTKEYIRFLYISLGSSAEVETQLFVAKNINYISEETFDAVVSKVVIIRKMLNSLISSLKRKI